MKPSLFLRGLVFLAALATVSCDKLRPPQPELQKPPASSAQATAPQAERTAFIEAAQKELDELKATVAGFKAEAEASGAEAKARLGDEVAKLEADLRDAQERLANLRAATVASWNQMKASFSSSMERLKNRVENFRKNAA